MAAADENQIYDDLMRFRPEGMSPNAWAMKAGVSRTVWADMRRHGNPARRTLEKLLTAAGSSLAEFEALRIGGKARDYGGEGSALADRRLEWGVPALPPLAIVATSLSGAWGDPSHAIEVTELRAAEIVDRVARPASLATDRSAFALTIAGESMWPRFRRGRVVAVSPKAPIAVGDDVLVRLTDGSQESATRALIKELVAKSATGVELRQFNPDVTFHVPATDIAAIEKVLGELV